MTDHDVFKACQQHGARRVYDAAYARLVGDHRPPKSVGLPGIVDMGEAQTILRIAYGCLRAENQAAGDADSPPATARAIVALSAFWWLAGASAAAAPLR